MHTDSKSILSFEEMVDDYMELTRHSKDQARLAVKSVKIGQTGGFVGHDGTKRNDFRIHHNLNINNEDIYTISILNLS